MKSIKRWNKRCQIYKLDNQVTFSTQCTGIEYDNSHLSLSKDGLLTIKARYEWNGCSFKIEILGMVLGTPEGAIPTDSESETIIRILESFNQTGMVSKKRKTFYASLIHDSMYQIAEKHSTQMDRRIADKIFLSLLSAYRFRPAKLYYGFVRLFGWLFWGKAG